MPAPPRSRARPGQDSTSPTVREATWGVSLGAQDGMPRFVALYISQACRASSPSSPRLVPARGEELVSPRGRGGVVWPNPLSRLAAALRRQSGSSEKLARLAVELALDTRKHVILYKR